MPHGKDLSWLDEVRDEVLEDQGLDEEDLPHLEDIEYDEILVAAEHIALLERRVTDETEVDDALTSEVDDAWLRLRELVLEELNRLADEEGLEVDEIPEAMEAYADALAERFVAEVEEQS